MALIKRADADAFTRKAMPVSLADIAAAGETILSRSRDEAARLLHDAKAERERLVADARQKGHDEGLAKGRLEGLKQGRQEGAAKAIEERRAELDSLVQSWSQACEQFVALREQLLGDAQREVLNLAMMLASRVIRRELEADPELVRRQIDAAVDLLARPTRAVIAVHPAGAKAARAAIPDVVRRMDGQHVELVEDASLPPGGCILRTAGGGEIDASIEAQIDRMARALLGERADEAEPSHARDLRSAAP